MSVIAVEKTEEGITFAWDTQMTYCDQPYFDGEKVKVVEGFVVGFTGQVVERRKVWNAIKGVNDLRENVETLLAMEFANDDSILISDKETIMYVKPSAGMAYEVKEFETVGSGCNYAIGAYHAGADLEKCVEIACGLNIYCGLPVKTLFIPRKGDKMADDTSPRSNEGKGGGK